jgi:hypothetical protein
MSFYINNFNWKFQDFQETTIQPIFMTNLAISTKYINIINNMDDIWCFQ